MMTMSRLPQINRVLRDVTAQQAGLGLLEVLIALALMGGVATVFINSLGVSTASLRIVDERSVSESLARSQMEYVKNQDFSATAWSYTLTSTARTSDAQPSWWDDDNPSLLPTEHAGFQVEALAEAVDIDGDSNPDAGAWRIEVRICRETDPRIIMMLESHKVDR